jgi:phospholipase C
VPSPTHSYYHHIAQINGGKNNLFAAVSAVGGWTMGYYDGSQFKLWQWAKEYTLADNFFQAAFGGSFLNHQWLICACTPRHWNAPDSMRTSAKAPAPFLDRQVTSDGWSVNTSQPPYQPSGITPKVDGPLTHAAADNRPAVLLQQPTPPQTRKTIGDTLSAKGVSWAWYAGAWNAALADGQQPPSARRRVIYNRQEGAANFQPHHQPFNYFANFAPGKAARTQHLKDGDDFLAHIDAGTLPAVAFYKPAGRYTQHPAYTDIISGDAHIAALLDKLRASRQWQDMLVIVTYDENGGYWDHVPPPTGPGWGDRWGPGSRVPTLLIGPHVKRGFVDKTAYDTTSIIKFITERFDLEPLPGVRAKVGDFSNALN